MPSERDKLLSRAERLLDQGKVDQALPDLERLARREQRDLQIVNRIGDLLARHGHAAEAIAHYSRVAGSFAQNGFLPKAIAIYKKIRRLDSNHVESLVRMGELYLGQQLISEARSYLEDAGARFVQNQQFEDAQDVYEKLARAVPDHAEYRIKLAEARAAGGHSQAAGEALVVLGHQLLGAGDPQRAQEVFERAEPWMDGDLTPWIGHAMALAVRGRPAEGLELLTQRPSDDPRSTGTIAALLLLSEQGAELDNRLRSSDATEPLEEFVRFFLRLPNGAEHLPRAWERLDAVMAGWEDLTRSRVLLRGLTEAEEDGHLPAIERLYRLFLESGERRDATDTLERWIEGCQRRGLASEVERLQQEMADSFPDTLLTRDTRPTEPVAEPTPPQPPPRSVAPAPAVPESAEDRDFASGHMTEAEVLIKYGLTSEAVQRLREVISRFPGHVPALERLVSLLKQSGTAKEHQAALVQLACAFDGLDDRPRAAEVVEQAKELGPLDSAAKEMLAGVGLVETESENAAGQSAPVVPEVEIAFDEGGEEPELEDLTVALSETEPSNGEAAGPSGQESLSDVLAAFKERVEEEIGEDDFRTHYDLGIAYKEMGLIDEAASEFETATECPEIFFDACNMLALCRREQGQSPEAIAWYRRALSSSPSDPETALGMRYDLADTLLQDGDSSEALSVFEAVLAERPDYRDVQQRIEQLKSGSG